jgi:DNA-binding transcriptional regulator YiaG
LDLGVSSQKVPDDVGDVIAMSEGFARQLYAAFRWVVTDEFLRLYGQGSDVARDNVYEVGSCGGSELARDFFGPSAIREQAALYGACAVELVRDTPYEIGELRRLTGMTWDALARVFGVSRRAVHLWANGGRMKDANARQLLGLLAQVRAERAGKGLPALAPRRAHGERLRAELRPPPPTHFISMPDDLPRQAGRVIASQPVKVPGKG